MKHEILDKAFRKMARTAIGKTIKDVETGPDDDGNQGIILYFTDGSTLELSLDSEDVTLDIELFDPKGLKMLVDDINKSRKVN